MNAKAYLLRLIKIEKMIENKRAEKLYWQGIAYSVTAGGGTVQIKDKNGKAIVHGVEKVQSSGSQQKMASAVDRYVDIEREIDECTRRLEEERQKIISMIERLDAIPYDILSKMYVGIINEEDRKRHYMNLQEIADLYGKSYSWADKNHRAAVRELQKILKECEEF